MWNYNFIIPSIMILLVFLVYYVLRPKLPVHSNSTFVILLLIDLATVYFDYTASVADESFTEHSQATLYALNLGYFVFFIARAAWFAFFTMDVLDQYTTVNRSIRKLTALVLAAAELVTLSSPVTGAVFSIDGSGYHSGYLYNAAVYYSFTFFLLLSFVLVIKKSDKLPRIECWSLLAYQMVLMAGIIFRYLNPHVLIMDLICLVAIIILFLTFENPDKLRTGSGDARYYERKDPGKI